jgi:hypothetical protein
VPEIHSTASTLEAWSIVGMEGMEEATIHSQQAFVLTRTGINGGICTTNNCNANGVNSNGGQGGTGGNGGSGTNGADDQND